MSDHEYFAARAAAEARLAEEAAVPAAKEAHRQLSELHAAASAREQLGDAACSSLSNRALN